MGINLMRRFGERPDPEQRYVTRPGAYGLIVKGDEALLTMSFEEEPSPQLPGGGIDRGENPIPALPTEPFHTDLWAPLEMLPELLIDPSQAEFVADFLGM